MNKFLAILGLLFMLLIGFLAYELIWVWGFTRAYVEPGHSLIVIRSTGSNRDPTQYAKPGQKGLQEQMLGPGRHFGLNPYSVTTADQKDKEVKPGYIRIVSNKYGKTPPPGKFIAKPDEQGIQEAVLTPGVWRINEQGQEVSEPISADQIHNMIHTGYVGVQTLQEGENKGILPTVLTAGYYNLNPKVVKIDLVDIGYKVWEKSVELESVTVTDTHGNKVQQQRAVAGTGVAFTLADGKLMQLDITVVWGVFPEDAPGLARNYGSAEEVIAKVIEPQVLSICKNAGANLTTQEFIEGEMREKFQKEVTDSLKTIGQQKGIRFRDALIRGFHPDEAIKASIQARRLAEEERLTLAFEQERDTVSARLVQAKNMVNIAVTDYDAETKAIVQKEMQMGLKKAAETTAQADRQAAELAKQTAEINAQAIRIGGKADADVIEMTRKAEAAPLALQVQIFGSPEAFNRATFAEKLSPEISIEYRYAGPGTFWTDTREDLRDAAAKMVLRQAQTQPAQ
jgi:hypothetical protein